MTQNDGVVRRWLHSRKGPIVGVALRDDGEWLHIRLVGDQSIRYASVTYRLQGPTADGDVLTVRKSFLVGGEPVEAVTR